jgi:Plasmid pRiA4b ORF-3-like protein
MSELREPAAPVVYQLRVVLRGVSPLIWRRLLVRGDSTVADLHATLQIALSWSDEHLHRFVIQGRQYGDQGCIDPRRVRLADLGLRVRERFLYEYDFTDNWQHDLRVEQVVPLAPGRSYPCCIGGRRAAPPEDCGGPWAFLERRQHYSAGHIARRLLNIFEALTGEQHHDQDLVDEVGEHDRDAYDRELAELVYWLRIDRFDRRAVNRQLAQLGQAARTAA